MRGLARVLMAVVVATAVGCGGSSSAPPGPTGAAGAGPDQKAAGKAAAQGDRGRAGGFVDK